MSYIVNLANELININFNVEERFCSSQNIAEDCRLATFLRQQGHILYVVAVINCNMENNYEKCFEYVESSVKNIDGQKIFTAIFVADSPDEKLIEFSHNDIEDYSRELLSVKWVVDVNNESVVVKGHQPDEIINIREAVLSAFGRNENTSISTTELKNQAENMEIYGLKCLVPYVSYIIFAINTLFLILMYAGGESVINAMALDKDMVSKGQLYRLFTYMFTHGGLYHWLCNNFSIIIIGSRVEKFTGHYKYMFIYILSGIFAGCTSYIVMPYGMAVGASGAIFGIVGTLIYIAYKLKHSIEGFDFYLAIFYALVSVACGFMIENVDNFAHMGGLVAGLLLASIIRAEK